MLDLIEDIICLFSQVVLPVAVESAPDDYTKWGTGFSRVGTYDYLVIKMAIGRRHRERFINLHLHCGIEAVYSQLLWQNPKDRAYRE